MTQRTIKKRRYNTKPNSTSFKKGHKGYIGKNNALWKGEQAGYGAKHDWIKLHFGKPKFCEKCKTKDAKKFEWANISKKYKRLRKDWLRLCTSCHRKLDGHAFTMWQTRKLYARDSF